MPQFQPDQVNFGDLPGYGAWDIGHGREHIQFVQALAAHNPPILIPDRDLLSFLTAGHARKSQVEAHGSIHLLLRQATGVQGFDLSAVNLDEQADLDNWLGTHAQEHAQIRQALGMF